MKNQNKHPQINFNQAIEDFLNALLDEAGMGEVSAEVRAQMFKDLSARLNDRLFATVVMSLNDSDLTKFRQMAEGGANGDELQKFIDSHIPNAADLFASAMMEFRANYLGLE